MSYQFITKYNSPNYTPANQVRATWGVDRTIDAIAIHWWDDPARNPSFEGVINTLCNPARGASAHFVATGTGRRVACLVDLDNASWATNSANPYTISIECDPRCRDEDYDVVAEVIAELRAGYKKNLPLLPHYQFASTQCPGNYDLARLDREAKEKQKYADPNADFGQIVITKPEPPKNKAVPDAVKLPEPIQFKAKLAKVEVWDLTTNPDYKSVLALRAGESFRAYASIAFDGTVYYVTEYSFTRGEKNGVNQADLVLDVPEKPPVVKPPVEPEVDRIGAVEVRLTALEKLVQMITSFLDKIFKEWRE